MYAILKKRALIISSIICLLITWGCSNFLSEDEQLLRIEIYSIECCPLCKQAKEEIPKKLKSEFGDSVVIDIIDVDEKGNHKKYNELINSINNFNEKDKNKFPLINVNKFFVIVGYDYYYDVEIVNDIIRMIKGNHLGKRLEKVRYIERD